MFNIKSLIKSLMSAHPPALNAVRKLSYILGCVIYRTEREWLSAIFGTERHVFFLQIGAHDGISDDNIYPFVQKYSWHGVLVEPVKYLFDRLIENYQGHKGLSFENKAIAERDGRRMFHRLRETADLLPRFYEQIGSLRLDVLLSHRSHIPGIDDYLLQEEVECVSFDTLVKRHKVTHVDLVLIDTEGYDLNILKTIDFTQFRPRLIIYEQKHLSTPDKVEAYRLLRSHGYIVHPIGANNAATRAAIWSPAYWHEWLRHTKKAI